MPPHNIPASFWLKFKIQHVSFLSRGLAPSSPLSFYQSFLRVFLQAAKSGVFSKVRVCDAQRSNESPIGAFKRVLRSKMEGPRPDKFTLTRHEFCGNLSQQFNIYIKGGAGAKDHGRERTAVQHLHPRSPRPAENSLFLCGGMGLDPQDSPAP